MNWQPIADAISDASGKAFAVESHGSVGGGCINEAYKISGSGCTYFIKLNRASWLEMFEAELAGLHALEQSNSIRVPTPICCGVTGNQAFLVLEHLSLSSLGSQAQSRLGQKLAELHRNVSDRFGWHRDNTIGSTPQINSWSTSWSEFFAVHRLGYQFELAEKKGLVVDGAAELCDRVEMFFEAYQPVPSLLHGDLWSGNVAMDDSGAPVLFDPACYYGDREAELAFTEMFGGFNAAFYKSYEQEWPLEAGYSVRKSLYNLYHVLNHYNLFGGSYGSQASIMVQFLLKQE